MEKIRKPPKIILKIKPFIEKYNWEEKRYLSRKRDLKIIEKNNLAIVFIVLYAKNEKIYPAYVSKKNSKCEKQVIILMIQKGEG